MSLFETIQLILGFMTRSLRTRSRRRFMYTTFSSLLYSIQSLRVVSTMVVVVVVVVLADVTVYFFFAECIFKGSKQTHFNWQITINGRAVRAVFQMLALLETQLLSGCRCSWLYHCLAFCAVFRAKCQNNELIIRNE